MKELIYSFLGWFKEFNNSYSNGVMAIILAFGGFVGWMFKNIYQESKRNVGDAALFVNPAFYSLGRKYKILAVHKYEKNDKAISGYDHKGQNSRPDQWNKLIKIEPSFFNLKFTILPHNKDDILEVVISRNGKEKWHLIQFNK